MGLELCADSTLEYPMIREHRLLTAGELADALSVSVGTVRRMTRDGQIPAIRVRSLVRYDLDAVLAAVGGVHVSSSSSRRAK